MRVLLDTNVVLDVLHQRAPWSSQSLALWQHVTAREFIGCISASALTDVYYLSRRLFGAGPARQAVRECLDRLEVLPVDSAIVERAYQLGGSDFEDALQQAVAARDKLDAIVTRDATGFASSAVPVLNPTDLLTQVQARLTQVQQESEAEE